MTKEMVQVKNLTVKFPHIIACNKINLSLNPGEVHAIIGENGAGKSTLMHTIMGLIRPAAGHVEVNGTPLSPGSCKASMKAGLAMVFQKFRLVPNLTVAQNVLLGSPKIPFFLSSSKYTRKIQDLSDRLGLDLDVSSYIDDISEGSRQQAEILRIFYRGATTLILDEPTSVLTPTESKRLIQWIRKIIAKDVGVFIISHKMPEVFEAADRISVMKHGEIIARDLKPAEHTIDDIAKLMAQSDPNRHTPPPPKKPAVHLIKSDVAALQLDRVCYYPAHGREFLENISFSLRRGEVLGVAGVSGNGQRFIGHIVSGLIVPHEGSIIIGGEKQTGKDIRAFMKAGIRYVPEDRNGLGSAGDMSVVENACLRDFKTPVLSRSPILKPSSILEYGREIIKKNDVKTPSLEMPAKNLSGGNLQKLILGRETNLPLNILVVAEPTQGLDLVASAKVYSQLKSLRNQGIATLLISSDLEELLMLCDRMIVMYRGHIQFVDDSRPFDREQIIKGMMGG